MSAEIGQFDIAAQPILDLGSRLYHEGVPVPDLCCALITSAVSLAEAGMQRDEAITMLRELLEDLENEV